MPTLHLRLLGAPEVLIDDRPVVFTRRRSLALLAFLAVTGRPHTRDRLAALLTNDISPVHASKHVSNALAELRRLIPQALDGRQLISFPFDMDHSIDTVEFEEAITRALRSGSISALDDALSRRRGEFLERFLLPEAEEFEEWAARERERLVDLELQASRAILAAVVDGAPEIESGIAAARRILELEPWSEDVLRHLMDLEVRTGSRLIALRTFERYQRRIHDEMGAVPEPTTDRVYAEIRAAAVAPPTNLPGTSRPLAGRADEIRRLTELLTSEECRTLNVYGLGGVGKTALALEVAKSFARSDARRTRQLFADGVFIVPLSRHGPRVANKRSKGAVDLPAAICGLVGLHCPSGAPTLEWLTAALRDKAMLLVLDGADGVESQVVALGSQLADADRVRLLVTSRRKIATPGQHLLELDGLRSPDEPAPVDELAATIEVFTRELAQTEKTGPLDDGANRALAQLSKTVSGNPLALRMAARLASEMSVQEIADRVSDDIRTLDVGTSNDIGSIIEILDESWSSLAARERAILARLTAFEAPFDHAAARFVGAADARDLQLLRERCLVTSPESGLMVLPLLVRHYVRQTVRDEVLLEEAHRRHAAHFNRLVVERALGAVAGESIRTLSAVAHEADVLAAWEWVTSRSELRLVASMRTGLILWFELTGRLDDGVDLLERGAALLRAAGVRGDADSERRALWQSLQYEEGRFLLRLGRRDAARTKLLGDLNNDTAGATTSVHRVPSPLVHSRWAQLASS